ncbi:MAG TPA: glycosyl hydrolase [Clostridiales bacterium]|nr:glycosyl hydrolase [Clostridiales bacterium]
MKFESFVSGDENYRPIAFWSLNHRLSKEELSWQIKELAEKGFQGFFMHSRSGSLTPYLSKMWFDAIDEIIIEAKKNGLKAWLYDEDPYPSGAAGGKVLADHPEYRAKVLEIKKQHINGPANISLEIPLSKVIKASAIKTEDNVIVEKINIQDYVGILRKNWKEKRYYHSYYPTTEHEALPQYRSDTSSAMLTLEWDVPCGEWDIVIWYVYEQGKYQLYDSYPDLMNPNAVNYFIETTYEQYKKRFSQYFGNIIPGIFMDEPKFVALPYAWNNLLKDEFEKRKGYSFDIALLSLALDFNDSCRSRKDYWEVVSQLFHEAFAGSISKWCEENGLLLTGHASPEEEPVWQSIMTGNLMDFQKYLHIPGTDIITYMIGDKRHPILNLGPKLVASVARQWRDGKALCECFGVTEWKLKIADMIWISNWLFSLGINIIVPHTLSYSIDGLRKKDAGPSQFYQNPYWEYYKIYSDYLSRLGYILGESEPVVKTALIFSVRNYMSLERIHDLEAQELRDRFVYLFNKLLRNHIQFDLVSDTDFEKCTVEGDSIVIGKCSYKHIIISEMICPTREFVDKVKEYCERGGSLIIEAADKAKHQKDYNVYTKERKYLIDCIRNFNDIIFYKINGDANKGFSDQGINEVVALVKDDILIEGEYSDDIIVNHHKKDETNIYFLNNTSENEIKASITCVSNENFITEECIAEEWNLKYINKRVIPKHEDKWKVIIAPKSAAVIILKNNEIKQNNKQNNEEAKCGINLLSQSDNCNNVKTTELYSSWSFKICKRNVLILDKWLLETENNQEYGKINITGRGVIVSPPWTGQNDNLFGKAKTLIYKTNFWLDEQIDDMGIVLEKSAIKGNYEIYVNGILCENYFNSREYDCYNIEYPLKSNTFHSALQKYYRKGLNVVAVKVKLSEVNDGLLEPLRLFGSFKVQLNDGCSIGATLSKIEDEDHISYGSWTYQGYPNFSGSAIYEQEIYIDKNFEEERCFIQVDVGKDIAEVTVNGILAGISAWEPYVIEITDMINNCKNNIKIKVTNTLENLLYGTQKPSGLLGPVKIITHS